MKKAIISFPSSFHEHNVDKIRRLLTASNPVIGDPDKPTPDTGCLKWGRSSHIYCSINGYPDSRFEADECILLNNADKLEPPLAVIEFIFGSSIPDGFRKAAHYICGSDICVVIIIIVKRLSHPNATLRQEDVIKWGPITVPPSMRPLLVRNKNPQVVPINW